MRKNSASLCRRGWFSTLVAFTLSGCATTLEIQPTLPRPPSTPPASSKVGVYVNQWENPFDIKSKSGVWPTTTYMFSPQKNLQQDLLTVTGRHFREAGLAENPVDERFDYVVEYHCGELAVKDYSFQSIAPLGLAMRNPSSGRDIHKTTLVGIGPDQGGKWAHMFLGRITAKRALRNSLNEAYSDLYKKLDGTLARISVSESETQTRKPYKRSGGSTPRSPRSSGRESR